MAISTYTELQNAVVNWLERDDLTLRVPEFIAIAEARHRRDIRLRSMSTRAIATVPTGTRFIALPTGFLAMRRLQFNTNPIHVVHEVSPDQLTDIYSLEVGRPTFFTVHEEIEWNRMPDSAYTAEMIYWKRFDPLSATVTGNSLLSDHPDIYLYPSLAASAPFLHEDERIQLWEALYAKAVEEAHRADRKDRYTQGVMQIRPGLVTP